MKERALLAYLAVEHSRPHAREALAELFWPDRPEGVARNNLRQALFGLRQLIGEPWFSSIFSITGEDIQFHLSEGVWLDLAAFDLHFQANQMHMHPVHTVCSSCIHHLASAVEIYRGDFLLDVMLDKNQDFQEWLLISREKYFRQQVQSLEYLINAYDEMGEYSQAAVYAIRLAQFEDLKESSYHRLMLLFAKTGRFAAALEQFDIYRYKLQDLLGTEPGYGISHLAEQIQTGQFQTKTTSPNRIVHNLPEQLTPFIGREMELARIVHTIENPAVRLITLTGPGGVGKTRLAVQTALLQLHNFPGGVFFVPMDSIQSPDQIALWIGHSIGLVPGGQEDMKSIVIETLWSRQALLILDNFEHLLAGKEILLEVLRKAPSVKILVTSRERLQYQAEQVIDLIGLSFPGSTSRNEAQIRTEGPRLGQLYSIQPEDQPEKLYRFDAVRLFLDRASRVRQDWMASVNPVLDQNAPSGDAALPWGVLPADEIEAIARICQLVDGLPLAIELAASWARDFSFLQIAEEMQNSLDFLQASYQDLPDRHRSLQASFEHSWNLLAENEREVFCKLAVFPGSFSVAAAHAVAGAALPWLIALEDKSLVRRVGLGRYELHMLIRQFAGKKLHLYSKKLEEQACSQHAHFYCAYLKDREMDLKGGRQAEALNEIECELGNIRTAWDWAVAHRSVGLFEMAGFSLMVFMEHRSQWKEGEDFFARASQSLQNERLDSSGKEVLAELMAYEGWFCCRLTRFDQAQEKLKASISLMDQTACTEKVFAHFALGFLGVWMYQFDEAWVHLSTSLALAEQAGNQWGYAWARELVAEIAFESKKIGPQEAPFLETLQLFERIGEKRGSSRALNYLGNIAITQGNYTGALKYLEKMITNLEKIGDVWGLAGGYSKLAQVAVGSGNLDRAWSLYQQGMGMLRKTGDQRRMAYALGELGELAGMLGKLSEAEVYFGEAFQTAAWTRNLPLAQDILVRAASTLLHCGQADRALEILQLVLSGEIGDPLTVDRAAHLQEKLILVLSASLTVNTPPDVSFEAALWRKLDDLQNCGLELTKAGPSQGS